MPPKEVEAETVKSPPAVPALFAFPVAFCMRAPVGAYP